MKLEERFKASFLALGVMWLISGFLFCVIVKGPGTAAMWAVWGTTVFLGGWVIVGVPLMALGDRIFDIPPALLAFIGGSAGALLMLFPNLIARLIDPQVHYAPFSVRDFAWPGVAFGVAVPTSAFYRFFLKKCKYRQTNATKSS